MRMNIVQKYTKMKNKNTHTVNELLGTHELIKSMSSLLNTLN